MTAEQFEDTLSRLMHREPFLPFVVEKNDGHLIVVAHPNIAHGHGGAVFFTYNDELVQFYHDEVRDMRPVRLEVAS